METKKQIRKRILQLRSAQSPEACTVKSERIMEKILKQETYQRADTLLIYVDYRQEVQTRALIEKALRDGKKVYCPRVMGDDEDSWMAFFQICALSELTNGYHGIMEPRPLEGNRWKPHEGEAHKTQTEGFTKESTLMIMPGVAFDRQRNRIGYGKGYYDRFLQCYGACLSTFAVCFDCQLVEHLEAENYDIKPDMVFTEESIYECKR